MAYFRSLFGLFLVVRAVSRPVAVTTQSRSSTHCVCSARASTCWSLATPSWTSTTCTAPRRAPSSRSPSSSRTSATWSRVGRGRARATESSPSFITPSSHRCIMCISEMELPLLFYVICGVILLILAILYPWKDVKRSRLSVYAILHLLYALMVVYVVYVRTIVDLSYVRDIYQVMCIPWLFPASLVLDVLTFIAACVPNNKSRTLDETNSNVFPMYRTSAAQANTALPISLIREAA
ncbi:uncharacterized protein LOC113214576 isoform X1 [Frankliniella occidentalis]|uniref:Uncharacterized protein LOC113214576 isoform X1 n=1 Tax=Frankliniella occidentalis TaxID=133901 RepID=A0A9C6X7X8_FRAOC|nr:uncharacterized protein LOC113214576 isoform X1 [Frankliniella occidentalis]